MVRVGIYNEDNEKERSEFIRALAEVELEIDQKLIDLEEQTDQILRNEYAPRVQPFIKKSTSK